MKKILIIILLCLVTSGIAYSEAISYKDEGFISYKERLNDLIALALASNPNLKAASTNVLGSEAMESADTSLNDPKLEFGMDSMLAKMVSISQEFPITGKLSLKGDIAKLDTKLSSTTFTDTKNSLIMDVKLTYFQIEFLDRSIEIAQKNKELLKQLISIVETKYSVGSGFQIDVMKSQLELSNVLNNLVILKQGRDTAVARLNTLLNRDIHTPFEVTAPLTVTPFAYAFNDIMILTETNSTLLQSSKIETEKRRLTQSLAKTEYYPDLMIKLSYTQNPVTPDVYSAFIGVTIPIWINSRQSKVAGAEIGIKESIERYSASFNNLSFKIMEILSVIERSKTQIDLYKTGIIPQAELALGSAVSGYQVNSVDFLTLTSLRLELFKYEIEYNEFIKEHEAAIAELSAIVGLELP